MAPSRGSAEWTVELIPYDRASTLLRQEFAALQRRVYPATLGTVAPSEPRRLHHPVFNVVSFYIRAEDKVASYAGAAMKQIGHAGQKFNIGGLSCVMTDPDYQRQGLASRAVAAATRYLERSSCEIGIFTCDPPLVHFYEEAGGWGVAPDIVLVGSGDDRALRSDTLNKAVLLRLFSQRAVAALTGFKGIISLDLPVGQFL